MEKALNSWMYIKENKIKWYYERRKD
jgi:hypothetical protein